MKNRIIKISLLLLVILTSFILIGCKKDDKVYILRKAAIDNQPIYSNIDSANFVSSDLKLNTKFNQIDVVWETSNNSVITNTGKVFVKDKWQDVTLTSILRLDGFEVKKSFDLKVASNEDILKKKNNAAKQLIVIYKSSKTNNDYNKANELIQSIDHKNPLYTTLLQQLKNAYNYNLALEKIDLFKKSFDINTYNEIQTIKNSIKNDISSINQIDNSLFDKDSKSIFDNYIKFLKDPTEEKYNTFKSSINLLSNGFYKNKFSAIASKYNDYFKTISDLTNHLIIDDNLINLLPQIISYKTDASLLLYKNELKTLFKSYVDNSTPEKQTSYIQKYFLETFKNPYTKNNQLNTYLFAYESADKNIYEQLVNIYNYLNNENSNIKLSDIKLSVDTINNQNLSIIFQKLNTYATTYNLYNKTLDILNNFNETKYKEMNLEFITSYKLLIDENSAINDEFFKNINISLIEFYKTKFTQTSNLEKINEVLLSIDEVKRTINFDDILLLITPENVAKLEKEVKDTLTAAYNSKLKELSMQKEKVIKGLEENNKKISTIEKEIDKLKIDLQNLKNSQSQDNEKINSLENELTSKQSQFRNLKKDQKDLRNSIEPVENQVQAAKNVLDDYKVHASSKIVDGYIELLDKTVSLLNSIDASNLNAIKSLLDNILIEKATILSDKLSHNKELDTESKYISVQRVFSKMVSILDDNTYKKEVFEKANEKFVFQIQKSTIIKKVLSIIFIFIGLVLFLTLQGLTVNYAYKKGYERFVDKLIASIPIIGLIYFIKVRKKRNVAKSTLLKTFAIKEILIKVLIYSEIVILAAIVIVPIIYMFGLAFSNSRLTIPTTIWPDRPSFGAFEFLLNETNFSKWYFNTFVIALINMLIGTVIVTGAAYVFARYKFKGKKTGLLTLLALQSFPTFMGLVAMYVLFWKFGLLGKYWALSIIYIGGAIPGNLWLIKGFMDNIPKDLDESAMIDGANKLQIFFKVIFPLSVPILTFVAVSLFMAPWMDYMLPGYLLNILPANAPQGYDVTNQWTVAVGLFKFINDPQYLHYSAFAAGALIVGFPITILYTVFQKYLIEGIMSGATKG